MRNEDTNFDTMRLLAGAHTDTRLSLDDIMKEFSSEGAAPVQEPAKPRNASQEATPAEDNLPEEFPAASPEREADIADTIANAIAASFPADAPTDFSADDTVDAPQTEAEPSEIPQEPPAEPPKGETTETKAPPKTTEKPTQPPKSKGTDTEKKDAAKKAENPVPKPGTTQKKIPTSHVRVGLLDSLGQSFGGLRERQMYDLPEAKASLKAAEKRNSLITRLIGIFAPMRYGILLLMILALAGRKYQWMLLGILGGTTGIYVVILATLVAMLSAWYSVLGACKDVVYFRFSFESLLLFATIVGVLDAVAYKPAGTLLPLVAIGWCLCGIASFLSVQANLRSLRTVIMGKTRKALRLAPGKWEKTDCIGKAPASTAGFVRMQEMPDTWHNGWTGVGFLLVAASVCCSAYLTAVLHTKFLSNLSLILTAALPVGGILCCARPYSLLTKQAEGTGAMAGWSGIRAMSGKKAVLIYDEDLFPKGTITHKGIKAYGEHTPQILVSCAASLVLRAENGLSDVFARLLRETNGSIYDVTDFYAMESGVCGRIQGVAVAVGTYQYMLLMGIMPPATAPKNGIFISIDRKMSGVFAIKYTVQSSAAAGLRRLVSERSLVKLVAAKNFVVNPSFIQRRFQVSLSGITCPKYETRRVLAQPGLMARGTTCGFLLQDGMATYGKLIAGSRKSCRSARFFTAISILLSVYMVVHMTIALATDAPTPTGLSLLLYQGLLWLLVEIVSRVSVE